MSILEIELKAILDAIAKALANGDVAAVAALSEHRHALCRMLAALDPVGDAGQARAA